MAAKNATAATIAKVFQRNSARTVSSMLGYFDGARAASAFGPMNPHTIATSASPSSQPAPNRRYGVSTGSPTDPTSTPTVSSGISPLIRPEGSMICEMPVSAPRMTQRPVCTASMTAMSACMYGPAEVPNHASSVTMSSVVAPASAVARAYDE